MLQRRRHHANKDLEKGQGAHDDDSDSHGDHQEKTTRRGIITWKRCRSGIRAVGGSKSILTRFCVCLLVVLILVALFSPRIVIRRIKRWTGRGRPSLLTRTNTGDPDPTAMDAAPAEAFTVSVLEESLAKVRSNYTASEKAKSILEKKLSVAMPKPFRSNGHRSFGCMRDTCRGLEIEDLFDRGFHRYFRSALKNDTSTGYNTKVSYRVTMLLLDTTQLNHMKTVVPQLYKKVWEQQTGSTYVIAFEGGDAMGGNKGFQLRQKDRFTRNFHCDYKDLRVQPTQYRLYVKNECEALIERSKNDKTTNYLLKPEAGSQGQGITFHASADEVIEKRPEFFPCQTRHGIAATNRFLVQEYISRPLLLNKCKFDARVYLYASSADPFLLWYHRGYLRRSLTPYSPTSRDRKAYLTNTHFQSSRANFNMSEHIWTFDRMQSQLVKQKQASIGFIESVVEPWMKEIARFVFESAREKIVPRRGSTQIIGLDFMLDERLHLHFIEANGYPGFTWSINFDSRGMVEDMVDLMTEQNESPDLLRALRPGDRFGGFHMVHSDARSHRAPYDPCHALADNSLLSDVTFRANQKALASALVSRVSKSNLGKKIIEAMESFVSSPKGRDLCSNMLVETFDLWKESDCTSLISSTSTGLQGGDGADEDDIDDDNDDDDDDDASKKKAATKVATTIKPSTSQESKKVISIADALSGKLVLFPSLQAAVSTIQRVCKSTSDTSPRLVKVQLVDAKELKLPLEKIAYPGGRRPLLPFHREGSAAKELLDRGLDLDGHPLNATDFTPRMDDPVYLRAERVLRLFSSSFTSMASEDPSAKGVSLKAKISYRIRWYVLVTSMAEFKSSVAMVFSHPGYAYSVRRVTCGEAPDKKYQSWRAEEHVMDLDLFQDVLTATRLVPSRYVGAVLEPAIRRVAEMLVRNVLLVNEQNDQPGYASGLFAMDWSISASTLRPKLMNIKLVSSSQQIEDEREQDVEGVIAKSAIALDRSRQRLESILRTSPTFFSRAQRGDSFEQFRIVFNPLEDMRFENVERNLCKDSFPSKKDYSFAIEVENLQIKRRNAMHRDLNKRIPKRWQQCRYKRNEEAKQSCMRPLLTERYRIMVKNNRLLSDEAKWVHDTFQGLLDDVKSSGSGGGTFKDDDDDIFGVDISPGSDDRPSPISRGAATGKTTGSKGVKGSSSSKKSKSTKFKPPPSRSSSSSSDDDV